jgi:hypothetical protein
MASILCPHCDHETPVPSLEQYLNKKVKCPSCGQTFRVEPESESESVEQEDDGAFDFESAPTRSQTPSRRKSSRRSTHGSATRTKSPSLLAPLSYDPSARQSSRRYPNLSRYITIFEIINKILFLIGLCGGVLAMLFGVYTILKIIDSGNSPVELIISLIFGVPFYFICIWLAYICAMAGLEFIRVVIDIENNTRE